MFTLLRSFPPARLALLLLGTASAVCGSTPDPWADARGNETPDRMTFVLTGDMLIHRRLSAYQAPAFLKLIERVRKADASFTNFESTVHGWDIPGAALSGTGGGTYTGTPAWGPEEMRWAGFNLIGLANNHSYDYGLAGMVSTYNAFRTAGITAAGMGPNLAMARAPAYLDTPKGRIALIACVSTIPGNESMAGVQRPDLPGRFGVNPLRFTTRYIVDAERFKTIHELARSTSQGWRGPGGFTRSSRPEKGDGPKTARLLGATFEEGAAFAIRTAPNAFDFEQIKATIREARRQADWIIVTIHAHEAGTDSEGVNRDLPAEFLVTFARASIDEGADIFVAHGPHIMRGIEVYKNKPILYDLGNIVFENDLVEFQAAENYQAWGLGAEAGPADFYDKRTNRDSENWPADKQVWFNAVAEPVFDLARNLQSIRIYPITLGYKKTRTTRGRPELANEADAKVIIDRLARLSEPFGTTIRLEQGVGLVDWKK